MFSEIMLVLMFVSYKGTKNAGLFALGSILVSPGSETPLQIAFDLSRMTKTVMERLIEIERSFILFDELEIGYKQSVF